MTEATEIPSKRRLSIATAGDDDATVAGRSYWQPEPANGYVTIHLTPRQTGSISASMGVQSIAPGGRVREHAHPDQEEIIFVLAGRGTALVDGVAHPMSPGSSFFLGKGARHTFINDTDADLQYTWTILPGQGLHEFFASIGRPRAIGQLPPAPFPRPDDARAIELRTGFAPSENPSQ